MFPFRDFGEMATVKTKRKLKILTLNYEYPPVGGGGGYICKNIMDELSEDGHKITIITSHFDNLLKEEYNGNLIIYRVPVLLRSKQDVGSLPSLLSYVPSCICKARKLMKENRFDIINTHFAVPSGPAGYYLSKKFGIPNVLSIYGGDIYDPTKLLSPHKTPVLKSTVRKMLATADHIISDSSDIKNHARTIYDIDNEITVIPPGVRPYKGGKKTRKELGMPENKIILTTLGRLVIRKNNLELIEIVKNISKTYDCHLLIMGDGPERSNLEKKINEFGLRDKISLMGRVGEEKFQIMCASDIYVSTAIHEGFGLVFLEAMESGLPVISYNNGGQVDFLMDNTTGFLVEFGDKEKFSQRLIELIQSSELRNKMSRHNREYIRSFYTSRCAEDYLKILNRHCIHIQ
jgi:glycosyltransferase involved in cell wall biosynthesis